MGGGGGGELIWLRLLLDCSSVANFVEACTQLQKKVVLAKGEQWGLFS